MKGIALAVGISLVVHVVVWQLVKDAFIAPKVKLESQPVEFDITNAPSPDLGRGSREAGDEGRTPLPKSALPKVPNNTTPIVQIGEAIAPSEIIEVEIQDSDVGGPHPDPLPLKAPWGDDARGKQGEGVPSSSAIQKADDAALVHARLAEAARRCYPAAARRFRQKGTVTVSFCADTAGGVIDAAVKESSGAQLLDDSALHCVLETAAPFPPEAASHCYAVPVRFDAQ